MTIVLLDAGPLGLLTNPRRSAASLACATWLQTLASAKGRVFVPEIADYEVRRELLRADKRQGLQRLDQFIAAVEYLPITTAAMRRAAEFWADARRTGQPTADDKALDADVILAAQVVTLALPGAVIATTNVGHLSRYAPAALWTDITSS